jgi:hypothetical protein
LVAPILPLHVFFIHEAERHDGIQKLPFLHDPFF